MEMVIVAVGIAAAAALLGAAIWVLQTLFDADLPSLERLLWLLIILMFPLAGALVWLTWGRDSSRLRPDAARSRPATFRKEESPH